MNFNFKLFDKVVDGFKKDPMRLAMGIPLSGFFKGATNSYMNKGIDPNNENFELTPRCKTIGCFAGWTNVLGEKGKFKEKVLYWDGVYWDKIQGEALKKLGLSESLSSEEYLLAQTLFHVEGWPEPFKTRYEKARTPEQKLRAALGRFSLFKKEVKALAKKQKAEADLIFDIAPQTISPF